MNALRGLARNRQAYRLFFEEDGDRPETERDILSEPDGLSDYNAADVAAPEDATVYRLSYAADEFSPVGLGAAQSGAESPGPARAVDTDELIDRLLSRLETDARLYTQDMEED